VDEGADMESCGAEDEDEDEDEARTRRLRWKLRVSECYDALGFSCRVMVDSD